MSRKKSNFTLLEVMIGVVILVLASGAIGWRIHRLLEKERLHSSAGQLKNLLLHSRMLALNTRADWVLQLNKDEKGKWNSQLICREDPDRSALFGPPTHLGAYQLRFDEAPVENFTLVFYSTGQVEPQGDLGIGLVGAKESRYHWVLPALFLQNNAND